MDIIRRRDFNKLLHWTAFRNAWFASVWAILGPMFAEGGSHVLRPLIGKAQGTVLDIGPGGGDWVHLFNSEGEDGKPGITKIYGIEPNLSLHPSLRQNVKKAGLSDVYEIVGAGAEELEHLGLGIEPESVDMIVTLQSLCCVPQPASVIRELYGYLKPGGTWIIYEHVKTHEKGWIRWYQGM
jgi:SAM-dependent methyltransferase